MIGIVDNTVLINMGYNNVSVNDKLEDNQFNIKFENKDINDDIAVNLKFKNIEGLENFINHLTKAKNEWVEKLDKEE